MKCKAERDTVLEAAWILLAAIDYVKKFYDVVGLVDILSGDHTDYYFDQLPSPMPPLGGSILICRRKS